MSDLFYVFGGALTALALIMSFVGLKVEAFPRSRGMLLGGIAVMTTLVVGSGAFAVALAREEADHRAEEIAEFHAEEEESEQSAPAEEPSSDEEGTSAGESEAPDEAEPSEATVLELTSPEDGALEFEPPTLDGPAGQIAIDYVNPSPVPHDVAIEDGGETLAQGASVTAGDTSTAEASLDPGEYVFYCSVPGHREAGMEGKLSIK